MGKDISSFEGRDSFTPEEEEIYRFVEESLFPPEETSGDARLTEPVRDYLPNIDESVVLGEKPYRLPHHIEAVAGQQARQPVPQTKQHITKFYSPLHGMPEISMAARMLSAPHDMGRMQLHDQEKSVRRSVDILAYLLATAPPSEQKTLLVESLLPLVEQLEPTSAPKITSMILELEQTEVLQLIEFPDALRAKVAEAMKVLRIHQKTSNPSSSY